MQPQRAGQVGLIPDAAIQHLYQMSPVPGQTEDPGHVHGCPTPVSGQSGAGWPRSLSVPPPLSGAVCPEHARATSAAKVQASECAAWEFVANEMRRRKWSRVPLVCATALRACARRPQRARQGIAIDLGHGPARMRWTPTVVRRSLERCAVTSRVVTRRTWNSAISRCACPGLRAHA